MANGQGRQKKRPGSHIVRRTPFGFAGFEDGKREP